MEKEQLERDATAYYAGLCTLPESADNGNTAWVLMNSKIQTNMPEWNR
jgi:hypothetical protein